MTAAESLELPFALQCVQLELLLSVDDVHDGVDQREVRERLRIVTEVAARGGFELLCLEGQWPRM